MKINLGCGYKHAEGWVNVDIREPADVILDLSSDKLPFKSKSIDQIYSHHVFEHVDFEKVIMECWRILKPGGTLNFYVPHFTSPLAYAHVEHRRFYSYHLLFYTPIITHFYVVKGKIIFGKGIQVWNHIVETFANKFPIVYETTFLKALFPAQELYIELRKRSKPIVEDIDARILSGKKDVKKRRIGE